MKGATAEPFDKTSSDPNSSIMMKIGSSQNFFRTRRNIQNSARNESISSPRIDDPPDYGRAAFATIWLAAESWKRPPSPCGLRRGSLRYDRACLAVAGGASEGWWGKKDSNLRSHKTADLQSAPFATRDTPPSNNIASQTAWRRRIRPWMTLIPRADGVLPVGAFMGEGGWQSQPRQAPKNGP